MDAGAALPAYERDPYLRELSVEVVEVTDDDGAPRARLSDTVLYPGGGGQPADRGTLDGVQVVDVLVEGGAAWHRLASEVAVGPARLVLDWARRFDHMQQHTAQHLLTATALARFGWPTTAFHLGPVTSDVELDVPALARAELDRLEDAVAGEIRAAHPVRARRYPPEEIAKLSYRSRLLPEHLEGELRLVEIEGVDLDTCAGTHVRSTSEVETLKLLGTQPMRGGTRVFFVAGGRVRRRLAAHEERAARLRDLLDASDDDLTDAARRAKEAQGRTLRRLERSEKERANLHARALAAEPGEVLALHLAGEEGAFLRAVALAFAAAAPEKTALLTGGSGDAGAFVVVAGDAAPSDVREAGADVARILAGRGGGTGRLYQGKASRIDRRDEALRRLDGRREA